MNVFMKTTCFLFLMVFLCYAQQKEYKSDALVDVLDKNTMAARENAINKALEEAVRKAVADILQSAAIEKHARILEDNIFSKAKDFVVEHKIIDEDHKLKKKKYFVSLRASVDTDKLRVEVKPLLMAGNPKILSLIEEVSTTLVQGVLDEESSASIAVEDKLLERGFKLVDKEQVNKIRAEEMERMGENFRKNMMDDPQVIARIAKQAQKNGARYLLLGTVLITAKPESGSIFQSDATFKCKVVDATTAEKIAATQKAESGRGNTRESADMNAGQRAGEVAAATIIPHILRNWEGIQKTGESYIVKLYGITSYGRQVRKFIKAIKKIDGVTKCDERLWDDKLGRLEVDVMFKEGADGDLTDAIFDAVENIRGFEKFDLVNRVGNNLNFKMK